MSENAALFFHKHRTETYIWKYSYPQAKILLTENGQYPLSPFIWIQNNIKAFQSQRNSNKCFVGGFFGVVFSGFFLWVGIFCLFVWGGHLFLKGMGVYFVVLLLHKLRTIFLISIWASTWHWWIFNEHSVFQEALHHTTRIKNVIVFPSVLQL